LIDSLSSPDLLPASETNMAAFWSSYGRAPGCRLVSTPNLVWFYTGIPHPLFNGVVSIKAPMVEALSAYDSLKQLIASDHAPALWWIGSNSKPEDLSAALSDRGLQAAGEVPGMAIDLAALDSKPQAMANFSVAAIDTFAMQMQWARTAAIGTGLSDAAAEAMAHVEATLADPAYRAQRRFLGLLNGVPVATSALVLDAGVAGVYAVATLPDARGKGIGTYMTAVALGAARLQGYRVAILQSSSMGHSIYRKMGFRDVCTYRLLVQS